MLVICFVHLTCYRHFVHLMCCRHRMHLVCCRHRMHLMCNRQLMHLMCYRHRMHLMCCRFRMHLMCNRHRMHLACYGHRMHLSYYVINALCTLCVIDKGPFPYASNCWKDGLLNITYHLHEEKWHLGLSWSKDAWSDVAATGVAPVLCTWRLRRQW